MPEAGEVPIQETPGAPKTPLASAKPPNSPEAKKENGVDALIIFGQGPVIDPTSREQATKEGTHPGKEDINLWSKNLAEAGSEIVRRGDAKRLVIMGGRTGGEQYAPEAELISKGLEERGIPADKIALEAKSTNTLENLVNFINEYLDGGDIQTVDVMGTSYHIPRIKLLMELFHIPYRTAFSSEEVIRFAARDGKDYNEWDLAQLKRIEDLLDVNASARTPWSDIDAEASRDFYSQQQGTEKKNIHRRLQEEDLWTRSLLEIPEYWLPYIGRIQNGQRIRAILGDLDQNMLRDRFGIDQATVSDEELKVKLTSIERIVPNADEEAGKPWDKATSDKLESAVNRRNNS